MVVPKFGQKWFLFPASRHLRTILKAAAGSRFFTVSALLEPANMPNTAKRQGHQLHSRILQRGNNLLSCFGRM